MAKITKREIAAKERVMERSFFYCAACDQVRLGFNTVPALPSYGHLATFARECPVDGTRMDMLKDENVDLSVVDYLVAQ